MACPDRFRSNIIDFNTLRGNVWLTGEIINDFLFHENLFPRLTIQYPNGQCPVHLERNNLRPDMSDLPISLRNLFLDISVRSIQSGIWIDKRSREAYNQSGEITIGSPPASVRKRHIVSHGAITVSPLGKIAKVQPNISNPSVVTTIHDSPAFMASPQAKFAKVQHNNASPGAKSAVMHPILSHVFSPSRDTAMKETADDTVSPVRRLNF